MLRRWQWNFCKSLRELVWFSHIDKHHTYTDRLENEHLGNVDQYRVTREVPLPYRFQDDGEYDINSLVDHMEADKWGSRAGSIKPPVHLADVPVSNAAQPA